MIRAVEQTMKTFGRIDILVTVAGLAKRAPAEDFPMDDFAGGDEHQRTRHISALQARRKNLQAQGYGKIITISSVRAFAGHPGGYAAYGTSKGAVNLLTKQLATEWAKYHINVNSIATLHLLDAAYAGSAGQQGTVQDLHVAHSHGTRGGHAGLYRRGGLPGFAGFGFCDRPGSVRGWRNHGGLRPGAGSRH